MALRLKELAKSTRPFVTRGSRVVRCEGCLLPENTCICAARPAPVANSVFVFLMAKGECYKPTNTGRLIADVAKENYAFSWSRTEPQPELLALLANPKYAPVIIFPHDGVSPDRCINSVPVTDNKIPLFIMLDGTWREAGRMFRKSAYLQHFPCLACNQKQRLIMLCERHLMHTSCVPLKWAWQCWRWQANLMLRSNFRSTSSTSGISIY